MSRVFYLFLIGLIPVFTRCSSSNCSNFFFDPINKIIRSDSSYDESYKLTELENKKKLLNKLCTDLKGQRKLLLIENTIRDKNSYFGLIYTYDNNKMYTYEQKDKIIKISKSNRFDKYGGLEKLFLAIRDSTIEKLKIKKLERKTHPDAMSTKVYYIDIDKNINKLFIL